MIQLRQWLAHPLTRGLDIDDLRTTWLRRSIIREKGFLRQIYQEWYRIIAASLPAGQGAVLEIGSGAGFLSDFIPHLITSEIFQCPGVRVVMNGTELPFSDASLRGIVMADVLHHIPAPRRFFSEAARCVRPQGVLVCIEPWVTPWSRLVYTYLHHEPFFPGAVWEFPVGGPLSGANVALPWMIFERDRPQFECEFPEWHIQVINPMMPFRYLVSGGVSFRSLMPACAFGLWQGFEKLAQRWVDKVAMFAHIVLRRTV